MTDEHKIYDLIVQAAELQQLAIDLHIRATAAINGLENAAKDLKEVTESIRGDFDFFLHLVAGDCMRQLSVFILYFAKIKNDD